MIALEPLSNEPVLLDRLSCCTGVTGLLALLAFIAFTVAAVLSCIRRGWEIALIAAGLALLTWPHIHV